MPPGAEVVPVAEVLAVGDVVPTGAVVPRGGVLRVLEAHGPIPARLAARERTAATTTISTTRLRP